MYRRTLPVAAMRVGGIHTSDTLILTLKPRTHAAADFWPEDAPVQPPKKGTDYRDVLPPTFEEVVAIYECAPDSHVSSCTAIHACMCPESAAYGKTCHACNILRLF